MSAECHDAAEFRRSDILLVATCRLLVAVLELLVEPPIECEMSDTVTIVIISCLVEIDLA